MPEREVPFLRSQAQKGRQLARGVGDERTAAILKQMAAEYDGRADALAPDEPQTIIIKPE